MSRRLCTSILVAWALTQACLHPALAASQTLPAFGTVQLCVPFDVQISPGNAYSLSVVGDESVASAITTSVAGSVLSVGSTGFTTSQPIQVTISLPAGKLAGVIQNGVQASALVSPGFAGSALSLAAGIGSGTIYVSGANYTTLNITNSGTGVVSVSGTFDNVNLQATGISNTYIGGVVSSVNVDLSGINNVYVVPTTANAQISGSASGISSVQYSQGICAVQSDFPLRSTCQQVTDLSFQVPTVSTWSSNVTATGVFSCSATGGTVSSIGTSPMTSVVTPPKAVPSQSSSSASAVASGAPAAMPSPATASSLGAASASTPVITAQGNGVPVPEPEAEKGSYNFAAPTPGGFQAQSGSTGAGGNNANAVAQGTNSASASAVSGPGGVSTQTSNDGTTNQFSTLG